MTSTSVKSAFIMLEFGFQLRDVLLSSCATATLVVANALGVRDLRRMLDHVQERHWEGYWCPLVVLTVSHLESECSFWSVQIGAVGSCCNEALVGDVMRCKPHRGQLEWQGDSKHSGIISCDIVDYVYLSSISSKTIEFFTLHSLSP